MLDVSVYTMQGEEVGKMTIDEVHLGEKVRPQLLKQAIVMYQANSRQGTAATKSRSMVLGSTRKLYRQKGTGRARMGSIRSPIRRGGGRAFAKRARDFGKRMPKKMRRLARSNAILAKILTNDVLIFQELEFDQPKTKQLKSALEAVGASKGCVLALDTPDPMVIKASRNIPKTEIRQVTDLNAYDVLRRNKLIFTKPAFETLSKKVESEFA